MSKVEWKKHFSKPVLCTITPREAYNGRALKPCVRALRGQQVELVAVWLMDASDPYPGEWVLSQRRSSFDALGTVNLFSEGDVTPVVAKEKS